MKFIRSPNASSTHPTAAKCLFVADCTLLIRIASTFRQFLPSLHQRCVAERSPDKVVQFDVRDPVSLCLRKIKESRITMRICVAWHMRTSMIHDISRLCFMLIQRLSISLAESAVRSIDRSARARSQGVIQI